MGNMMVMITIDINDDQISAALASALTQLDELSPVMNEIGARLGGYNRGTVQDRNRPGWHGLGWKIARHAGTVQEAGPEARSKTVDVVGWHVEFGSRLLRPGLCESQFECDPGWPLSHCASDRHAAHRMRITCPAQLAANPASLPTDVLMAIADQVARMYDQSGACFVAGLRCHRIPRASWPATGGRVCEMASLPQLPSAGGTVCVAPSRLEQFAARAFSAKIGGASDMHFLAQHDFAHSLASRSAGKLKLRDTPWALEFDATETADMAGTTWVRDFIAANAAGLIKGLSQGLRVAPGGDTVKRRGDGILRTVKAADLMELSAVTVPAYPMAQIKAPNWQARAFNELWHGGGYRCKEMLKRESGRPVKPLT
jgi:HK97 family phage prohead protease